MIVKKAVRLAQIMEVPVLGIVENMSYFTCSKCGERHYIFGESGVEDIAEQNGIAHTAELPIDPELANYVDSGIVEMYKEEPLKGFLEDILKEV